MIISVYILFCFGYIFGCAWIKGSPCDDDDVFGWIGALFLSPFVVPFDIGRYIAQQIYKEEKSK